MTFKMTEGVVLRRLTAQDLPAIAGWFQDPDTSRFLGGPDWPAAMLANAERAVGTVFRGARQTAADHFLALADSVPVGYIDCGTFDACAVYGGEGEDGRSSSRRSTRSPARSRSRSTPPVAGKASRPG